MRFIKNSVFGTAAAALGTSASFISSIIVARVCGVGGTGVYAFAIWIVSIATTLIGAGIPMTMSRYLPEILELKGEQNARRLISYVGRRALLLNAALLLFGAAILVAYSCLPAPVSPANIDVVLWALITLCCTAQACGDYTKGCLRGMHRLDLLTQYLAVGTVFQLLGILVLSFYFGAYGALVGYLIGVSVPCLLLFELIVAEPEIDKDMSIRLVSYARMRWLSELAAAFVFSRVEIFFLQYYWGADAVGFFTVSLTLSNLAVQGPLMLTWGFLPHFSAQFAQRHLEGIQTSYAAGTRLLAFMVFPACVGLAAITPELLPILFGDQFAAAITPAQILVCAASLSASATVGANLIWAMERTDADLYINLFGAVISILCGFLLIGPFGVYGAAYSRAATQVVVIGLGTWFVHRKLGIKVPFKSLCLLFGCAAAAGFVARISVNVFAGMVGIVLAICCAAVTYFALTFLCGALTAHDRAQIYRIYSRVTSSILSRFPSDQT